MWTLLLGLLVNAVIGVAAAVLVKALSGRPQGPSPAAISQFSVPTVDATRPIPVIFGTCKLTGANVIWYGDLLARGFQINGQDAGFYYYLGMDLALCQGPVDSVDSLLFGDIAAPWVFSSTISDHDRYTFDASTLFGGNTKGGGVSGSADVYYGTTAQGPNDYMQSVASADWPGLPTLCHVVLRKPYLGTNTFIPPVGFIATRCPNQLGLTGGNHRISYTFPEYGYDANPACILYEILTDTTWGLSIPGASIDSSTFVAAGNTLFGENLGIAMILENATDATQVIADILRYIEASIYVDPVTGLLSLSLIRADYVLANLPVLDQTSIDSLEMTRGAWSETTNIVRIHYTSRVDNFSERIVQWQNLSNLQMRGERAAVDIDFHGFSSSRSASLAAGRALKALSYPFARLKFNANRSAWALRPGSPFVLNWPALGIAGMVCRVTRPTSGELTDGKIAIEAIEDATSFSGVGYTPPVGTSWVNPQTTPTALTVETMIEAPYQIYPLRMAITMAARNLSGLNGYQVWSDPAGGTSYAQSNTINGWCPTGTLTANYAQNTADFDTTGFTVQNLNDGDVPQSLTTNDLLHGVNLALIDQEIIAWQTIAGSGSTRTISNIYRGVLDTVPAAHSTGAVVYFFTNGPLGIVNPAAPYAADGTVTAKLLPFNSRAILPLASATQISVTTASRAQKPLPPGKVRLNGAAWPTSLTAGVDVVVTWAIRHRTLQAAAKDIVSQGASDYAISPEGNFTIEVRVGGVVKRTVTAIATTTWTWTAAMQTTDGATGGSSITIRIYPVNGALTGTYQERAFTF
jgi:Putative phage tail protein